MLLALVLFLEQSADRLTFSIAWSIPMEQPFTVRPVTLSLPGGAGLRPGNWLWDRSLTVSKTCKHCGMTFHPHRWKNKAGRIYVQTERSWNAQEFCSISCGKRYANPMFEEATRKRVSQTLRRIGHKPPVQGGNGKPLSKPQAALLQSLGSEWRPEFSVATGMRKKSGPGGYPTCYKIDIANPEKKIAIEVDGQGHSTEKGRKRDAKKTAFLVSRGWSVYRVSNARALFLCSTCTSADTLLTSLTGC